MEIKNICASLNGVKFPQYKWNFKYCKNDTYIYQKEFAPNVFHRFMQRLILGVVWTRIKD